MRIIIMMTSITKASNNDFITIYETYIIMYGSPIMYNHGVTALILINCDIV